MPTINVRELKRLYELDGPQRTCRRLAAALASGHLRPEEFSLRDLAEALVPDGREFVRLLNPRSKSGGWTLLEAHAVDTTAFANITGQVVYAKVLQAYQSEAFVVSRLVATIPTPFSGEKLPGVGRLGDMAEQVEEGQPYPTAGVSEEYVETPATTKRGFIVPVTKEAVFFDRTNLVLQRAAEVGEFLGLNKEKRLIDVVIGAANTYRRNGKAYDTYLTAGPWVNDQANELVDWTDVEQAELLLRSIVDPSTGEPILVMPNALLVMPAKWHTARRIINATEIQVVDNTAGAVTQRTTSANPLAGSYAVYQSQLAKSRIVSQLGVPAAEADQYWFLGDFRRAFAYMENWPITVVQAPANSEAEFSQDIVARFKASERGAAAVLDPRYVVRNKNA
jgi:hypothetical protein